ncbi:hypothetical protein HB762_26275 (plasmid) [Vibrio campbellii]|uniref:Uncharacterized protein n=1 Tax=Vibrio campbellii TaxID=680 RepID=A0ABY5IMC5_9VIBR|nr:DotH/IcmK family type IV secretion protein [Vibrio campbellii]UTZ34770.1 hypothetical protein HB762_26275 [Vibrio campbellii]
MHSTRLSLIIVTIAFVVNSSCVLAANENQQFTATVSDLTKMLEGQVVVNKAAENETSNRVSSGKKYDSRTVVHESDSSQNHNHSTQDGDWLEVAKLMKSDPLKQQQYIAERLSEVSDPEFVLQELVRNGELALTPEEIRFILSALDLKSRALNTPLMTPDVVSGLVEFNPKNRYSTYEFNIHESGITTLEFFDANGERWKIVDFTPANGFKLNHGYHDNMLTIQSEIPYKQAYTYVHLDGYKNQISIKLNYNNQVRDGIRTFTIPFLYKINEGSGETSISYTPLSSIRASDAPTDSQKIPDLVYQDLMYIATMGFPDENGQSYPYFKKVFVDKPEIAQIWSYGSKYIVRSRFQLMSHQYQAYVPSSDDVAVYVADELDTVIDFNVSGKTESVYLPDYHLY